MYCVWLSSVKATSNLYLLNAIISPSLPLLVILWVMKQEHEARGLSPAHPWSAGRWVRSLLPGWLVLTVSRSQDLYFRCPQGGRALRMREPLISRVPLDFREQRSSTPTGF